LLLTDRRAIRYRHNGTVRQKENGMALRRSRSRGDDEGGTKGFADRIATATKPEPSGSAGDAVVPTVSAPGLSRYQRRSADLPEGAKTLTAEEVANIVIDLRDQEEETDSE
jgi:hypothetical protein